jgi:hypothetical protein
MYAAKVWDLSIVQGAFSVAPCQTLALRFTTSASLYGVQLVNRSQKPGSQRGVFEGLPPV